MKLITRERAMKLLQVEGFYSQRLPLRIERDDPKYPEYAIAVYKELFKYGDKEFLMTMVICSKKFSTL